jgi:hypothetical protein
MKRPGEVAGVVEVAPARVVPVVEGGRTVVVDVDRSDVEVEVFGDPHADRRIPTPTAPMKQHTPLLRASVIAALPCSSPMKIQHSEHFGGTA